MATFKDSKGNEWQVIVHYKSIEEVEFRVGLNLLNTANNHFKELENPVYVGNALYVLCERQITSRGMDDYAFGIAIAGDCYPKAVEALMRAIVNFFPNPRRRILTRIVDAVVKENNLITESMNDITAEKLDAALAEFESL